MSNLLRKHIAELAEHFAEQIVQTIKTLSLEDILAEASSVNTGAKRQAERPTASSPAARNHGLAPSKPRTNGASSGTVDNVVTVLRKYPDGLRAELLRSELGLNREEMHRVTAAALAAKKISKQGARRGTKYFLR